jgi:hypothetical protein
VAQKSFVIFFSLFEGAKVTVGEQNQDKIGVLEMVAIVFLLVFGNDCFFHKRWGSARLEL